MSHYKFIVNHLTDTDVYKYNMGQVLLHQFPNERSKWLFTIRSTNVKTAYLKDEVEYQLDHLCELKHGDDELNWFADKPWYSEDYIEWLRDLRLNRKDINVARDGDTLGIWTDGREVKTHWFETLTLPIVQELWMLDQPTDYDLGRKNLAAAVDKYNKVYDEGYKFTLSEFGTRRRASFDWQEEVILYLMKKCKAFVGTSNVWFAMKHGLTAIGTIAHQMFMLLQAIAKIRLCESQRATLDAWVKEFRGLLGIFLTDTYGVDAFLRDFDLFYAKLSDGVRHDSQDPFLWGQIFVELFKQMKIDPLTKTLCFSDSLNDDKVVDLAYAFAKVIKVAIGQGTFLTNNVGGNPLNMVMKLDEVNGIKVIKLSDDAGKCNSHDVDQINEVKRAFKYKPLSELSWMKDNPEAITEYVKGILKEHQLKRVWRG